MTMNIIIGTNKIIGTNIVIGTNIIISTNIIIIIIRMSFSMFWPAIRLLGCYFHFSQLVWRRVKRIISFFYFLAHFFLLS